MVAQESSAAHVECRQVLLVFLQKCLREMQTIQNNGFPLWCQQRAVCIWAGGKETLSNYQVKLIL